MPLLDPPGGTEPTVLVAQLHAQIRGLYGDAAAWHHGGHPRLAAPFERLADHLQRIALAVELGEPWP